MRTTIEANKHGALALLLQVLKARFKQPRNLDNPIAKTEFMNAIKLAGAHGVTAGLAQGLKSIAQINHDWQVLIPFVDILANRNAQQNQEFLLMMKRIEKLLREKRIKYVHTHWLAENSGAEAFWQKEGYKPFQVFGRKLIR